MKNVRFLVYKGFHASAPSGIKKALVPHYPSIRRLWLNHPEMTFKPKPGDAIINWGCIVLPEFWNLSGVKVLNHPNVVRTSTHRIQSLTKMKEAGVNVPEFTTEFNTAKQWLADGRSVIARKQLRSFGGHGLSFVEPTQELPNGCPLYVQYRPKKVEYRVHVFRGAVIDVQQKKRRSGIPPQGVESKIRSYANGWVFCREGVSPNAAVLEQSTFAVKALGLDFAAVDVGWNEKKQMATVYECNSAPGLEGKSINLYAEAFRHEIG